MDKHIVLKPRLSEKTFAASQKNVYVFDVPTDVNKHTVARAVASQFEVTVTEVNIANIPGKAKRLITKKGRRVSTGTRSDRKKAYVTLAEGQSLPFFADNSADAPEEKETK